MKYSFIIILTILTHCSLLAQDFKLEDNQFEGGYVSKTGEQHEGYIELGGDPLHPWKNQTVAYFFTMENVKRGKVVKKKKLQPRSIQSIYSKEWTYESRLISPAMLNGSVGAPSNKFLLRISSGRINTYVVYLVPPPKPLIVHEYNEYLVEQREQKREDIIAEPLFVVEKDGEKFISLEKIDLRDVINDCAYLLAKFDNNEFPIPYKNAENVKAYMQSDHSKRGKIEYLSNIFGIYNEKCGQ